ncbi:hydrogenase maturation protease [Okeania sp. SIO1I7]|uniref:hydrogenase maturation protease n=1 Tax=Okeania sp. SIO1I7 TaxID=2607772 RepID=UPI0013FAEA73|nr:hydrogenase maturation protease [Okeania sp. SIO1I7]NET29693.1 hydrogenase maturation protease [Okeania sp. SIO1I7]
MAKILIIGYGNTLRSDDGAGQQVAELVAEWKLPNVRSLPVHQLTPEFAEPISQAELVIFVDAYPATSEQGLQIHQLCVPPSPQTPPSPHTSHTSHTPERGELESQGLNIGHTGDPRSLLALSQFVYNNVPPAWWILIPAVNFEFGEDFSRETSQGITDALAQIQQIVVKQKLKNYWQSITL